MHRLKRRPRLALAAGLALALTIVAVALRRPQPAIKTFTPKSENQITNLDVLRQQIRNYYGDPLGTGVFAPDGNYAKEASGVAEDGAKYLARWPRSRQARLRHQGDRPRRRRHDAGDVELRDLQQLGLQPDDQRQFVTDQRFPPVPGMVDMVKAASRGFAIFFLTGRGALQEAATLGNLTSDGIGVDAGYPPTTLNDGEDGLFTKPAVADYPHI